jgi:hypothetical protein
MPGVITTGAAPKTLWPGVLAFWGDKYNQHEKLYPQLFDVKSSKQAYEETPELIGFGLAPEKTQTSSVSYDTWRQGPVTRFSHVPYALGFIVTHEEVKDNLYSSVVSNRTASLARSMRTTREIVGANIYNRAFTAGFVGGDGIVLNASTHPTDDGTQSNVLTVAANLSEQSIEDLAIQVANADDSRGLRINLRPQKLVIPTALEFNATRILKSALQNDTANNALNALSSQGTLPGGFTVNTYLTDTTAWWMRTDAEHGMCWFDREETTFAQDGDFDTGNLKHKAYMRFVPGWSDWRGLYGTPGV